MIVLEASVADCIVECSIANFRTNESKLQDKFRKQASGQKYDDAIRAQVKDMMALLKPKGACIPGLHRAIKNTENQSCVASALGAYPCGQDIVALARQHLKVVEELLRTFWKSSKKYSSTRTHVLSNL